MADRYDQTTSIIRDAAVRELVERGHSLFTMESVAKRSYSSVGSVYARFSNRTELLSDILHSKVLPSLRELRDHGPAGTEALLRQVFGDPSLGANLHSLVEIALASRVHADLVDGVREGLGLIHDSFHLSGDDQTLVKGLRHDLTAVVLGFFVLVGAGCSVPPLSADLAHVVELMLSGEPPVDTTVLRALPARVIIEPPVVVEPQRDQVANALIDATGEVLAESGLEGAHLRDIAKRAGVSTGALYRRYRSKSELLNDGLVREMNNDKNGWTGQFIEALLAEPTGRQAAEMMASKIKASVEDPVRLLAGIEILQAARADELMRQTIATQVHAAANDRSRMLEELVGAGIVHDNVSPSLFGWLPQIRPAGERLLVMMGLKSDDRVLVHSLQAYLRLLV